MINGITVLDTASRTTMNPTLGIIAAIALSLGIILVCIGNASKHEETTSWGAACIVTGIIGIIMWAAFTPPVKYNEYKVTIDDTVSLNAFNSKYEIIEQEGKIYTIIEKEK